MLNSCSPTSGRVSSWRPKSRCWPPCFATRKISRPRFFGQIQADINALGQVAQGGQALAYSLGNLDQLFRTTYPGYGTNPTVYYTNYQKWSQTSLDTNL